MSDTELENVQVVADATAPKPKAIRRPPPPRRSTTVSSRRSTPPPARAKPDGAVGAYGGDPIAELVAQNRELMQRLERLERGNTSQFVESEPPPKPTMREANPATLSPFTRRLLARTHDMPEGGVIEQEPTYNIPTRWYLRKDGDYVKLQGDAKNRAMYEDLGLYCLTLEEAADFEKNERPGILREQHTRAALINGLRQLVKREATLSGYIDDNVWDTRLDSSTIDELEEEWHTLCRQTANPDRRLPAAERYRQEPEPLLAGVETSRSTSLEDLQRKLTAPGSQSRTLETREFEVTQANAHMFS